LGLEKCCIITVSHSGSEPNEKKSTDIAASSFILTAHHTEQLAIKGNGQQLEKYAIDEGVNGGNCIKSII
jgi:hypothetical protein